MLSKFLSDTRNHKKFLWLVAVLILMVTFSQRLWLLQTKNFDNDEFEHMHSAWLISEGQLPYLDYFEHHTPAMHFFLAQFFTFFDVETDFSDARAILILSRRLMLLLSGVILILTFYLGSTWKHWRVGLSGAVFLVFTLMFQEKTLEIRPDLLSLPCWLGSLAVLMQLVKVNPHSLLKRKYLMFTCGLLLGCSIISTQKMLFAMPGFTLAMFVYWFSAKSSGTFNQRFILILFQLTGFFTPILLMLGYFHLHQGAYAFIEYNLLLNLGWKVGFSPWPFILELLIQNPFLTVFGIIGLVQTILQVRSDKFYLNGDYIMVINLIGLLIGLFIIPVPWKQYFLIFLPLLAIFAANFLIRTIDGFISTWSTKGGNFKLRLSLFLSLTAILFVCTMLDKQPIVVMDFLKKSVLLVFFICCLIPIRFQFRDLTIALLLIAMHLPTVNKFKNRFKQSNEEQFKSIQYVIENSPADATFMDGWKGIGLFRQHAYFYWMLHHEIRGMLSETQKQQLLEDLETGRIDPLLINLDEDLKELSPEITKFILENYEPVGVGDIRKRVRSG